MAEGDFVRESLYDFWGTGYVWGVVWDFLAIECTDESAGWIYWMKMRRVYCRSSWLSRRGDAHTGDQ
jgi:hypothetical protein